MVLVPASSEARGTSERDLLIDRFEVTDEEFAEFLHQSGYVPDDPVGFLSHWRRDDGRLKPPPPSEHDLPVRHVSFEDALAYARFCGKELPSRDEWLRACPSLRDGALPWRGRAFAGACNSVSSGLDAPMPVGSYELGRSPAGCYDVIGNVREWSSTRASPEKLFVLGGSFRQLCRRGDEDRPGNAVSSLVRELGPAAGEHDARLEPWENRAAPGARADDLGFRCVVRDADRVLDLALAQIEPLRGPDRRAAIDELLRTGERPFAQNVLLPIVRGRAFDRRVRWAVELTSGEEAPLRDDVARLLAPPEGGIDEVVVAGSRSIVRLDAADGRVVGRVSVPLPDGRLIEEWTVAPGGSPALWAEGRRGELVLVEFPSGLAHEVAAPSEGRNVVGRWLAGESSDDPSSPAGATPWIVQQLDLSPDDDQGGRLRGDLPRARVVRVDGRGVAERTFAGEVSVAPPPAGRDGLLLLLHHEVDVSLPVGGARQRRGSTFTPGRDVTFDWASLEFVRAADLKTSSSWLVAVEPQSLALHLPPNAETRLRWLRWRFVRELRGRADVFELDATDDVVHPFVSTTRRASCLFDAGLGRWYLLQARQGTIAPPTRLEAEGAPDAGFRLLPAGPDLRCVPLLVRMDGSELQRIDEEEPALARVASGLSIPERLSWIGLGRDRRRLVVYSRGGRWLGIDLERARSGFELALHDEASIHPELVAVDGDDLLVCQSTPTAAWLRSARDGRSLDEFGVARTPIRQVLVARANGGRAEPLVLFDDGRLVALGPPEPESDGLVEDFLGAARDDGVVAARGGARGGR